MKDVNQANQIFDNTKNIVMEKSQALIDSTEKVKQQSQYLAELKEKAEEKLAENAQAIAVAKTHAKIEEIKAKQTAKKLELEKLAKLKKQQALAKIKEQAKK